MHLTSMQNSNNPYGNPGFPSQQPRLPDHPEATMIMILGIVSIVLGCNGIGLVLGIISVVKANKALQEAGRTPGQWSENSLGNLRTGKICGTIGIVLGSLAVVGILAYVIFYMVVFGALMGVGAMSSY